MYLTGVFKIHNPSRRKRQVLDHALESYTRAMDKILVDASRRADKIREDTCSRKRDGTAIEKWVDRRVGGKLLAPQSTGEMLSGALSDGLRTDAGRQVASHFALTAMGEDASFPEARDPRPDAIDNAMHDFCFASIDEYDKYRDRMLRQARGSVTPILFPRERDCPLVVSADGQSFFAMLNILAMKSPLGVRTTIDDGNLIHAQTGEVISYRGKSKVLFPLQVGKRNGAFAWQYERFLDPIINGDGAIKECHLVRRDGKKGDHEYFVHYAIDVPEPEPYTPETYLGVDVGILYTMAYAIVAPDGGVIKMVERDDGYAEQARRFGKRVQERQRRGKRVTMRSYGRKAQEQLLHEMVNEIIEEAIEHRSQIVLEGLSVMVRGKFVKSAWAKIKRYFEYKCALAGVPLRTDMWAAYTSKVCLHCGEINAERQLGHAFVCPCCGATYPSDAGAAVNIARRMFYRKKEWSKAGGWKAFHKSFANVTHLNAENGLRDVELIWSGISRERQLGVTVNN